MLSALKPPVVLWLVNLLYNKIMIGMIFAMKNIRNFRFIHPLVGVLYYCIVTSFFSCGDPVNISDGGNGTNQSGCTWHNSKSAVYYDPYLLLPCSNGCSDQVFENFNLDILSLVSR